MVARLVRDQEVVGSNPVASTRPEQLILLRPIFLPAAAMPARGISLCPPLPRASHKGVFMHRQCFYTRFMQILASHTQYFYIL